MPALMSVFGGKADIERASLGKPIYEYTPNWFARPSDRDGVTLRHAALSNQHNPG
jgi:hypothetical protein